MRQQDVRLKHIISQTFLETLSAPISEYTRLFPLQLFSTCFVGESILLGARIK